MKKLALAAIVALIFSVSGHAEDFEFQTYSNETPTTTTQGGQANESGSNWYLYGEQRTFSTSTTPGSNPNDSQATTSGGLGYRF
jgi:hypothetical protein